MLPLLFVTFPRPPFLGVAPTLALLYSEESCVGVPTACPSRVSLSGCLFHLQVLVGVEGRRLFGSEETPSFLPWVGCFTVNTAPGTVPPF